MSKSPEIELSGADSAQLDGLRRQMVGREAKARAHKFVLEGLFDLSNDLGETTDLSETHPRKLAELTARCAHWRCAMDQAEPRGPFRDF